MSFEQSWWFRPRVVFHVSIFLYILRVVIKIGVGLAFASPLLVGDGVHNIGDAGVLLAAYWVIWFIANKSRGIYGPDNLPALFQLSIAVLMGVLAFWVGTASIEGLMNPGARHLDLSSLGVVSLTMVVSVAISLGAGAYQVRSGEPTLVAAGKEMRGDALIECSILAGFLGEYLFSSSSIEYGFGLVVVFLIGKTAWEMGSEAKNTLLQVSLGEAFEEGIRALVSSTYGVGETVKLETYPVLQAARIKVWVLTQGGAEANEDIREALRERIREYAEGHGHSESRPDVYFALPDPDWHRVLYALVNEGGMCFVAPNIENADMLRVCAIENGEIVSGEDIPAPKTLDEFLALVRSKHIRVYRAWNEKETVVSALHKYGVHYKKTPTILPPE
ncbi:MAG: hypothetical protein A3C93_03735 [Candidatus Lloydbacteria bacterium RIFCSPHIGHO2_02_FULL_54_17]|uniref:Cation efflux protein transmembrane domain-containing protein n=1 Tax=Candidatus Lloydbacteria bacterium RIFCSPHIGHO2_02_FULL_54_17 TaxID=1798664 RepID=A0A1G2DDR8_9BACT|nr:MAG: hypothetical protein A2762_01140 [Candidatus Lloydbacteria bacterium RIFCSPHIGHO2_01_FULL_54_11]OGZ11683.1 MAG: hypothetical protein A3C93_03735 [Candidatus Lloydbacteria bacterium RIFCSPHIGHO2_02_FULL_54_17]OGZ16156.1 MAG: hypothetical protein A3H76_05265 [Candidatus Lloydbacteria bacterium RIFCSPLOWO2_02_FULL_54_12]